MSDYFSGSDALNQWAEGSLRLSRTLSAFSERLQEAERVSQYSSGLAAMDRAFSTYNRSLKDKRWARPRDSAEIPGSVDGTGPGTGDAWTLGQIDEATLAADHDAMVKEQRAFIMQNFRNRKAQEQLLQVLERQAVQNYDRVADLWGTYKTHELIAESDRNIKHYAAKTDRTPEQRVAVIKTLLQSDVERGLRFADDAAVYLEKITDEIQSSWAVQSALEQAKAAKWDVGAADAWLDANTPFWDLDPAKREAARNTVRDRVAREQREQQRLDDMHDDAAWRALEDFDLANHDELEALRKGIENLPQSKFRNPEKQTYWLDRWSGRIAELERIAAGDATGPDLDKQDDPSIMKEYLQIRAAFDEQRPLTFQPNYSVPGTMKSLAIGQVPNNDDLKSYLLANYGAYVDKEGLARPRLRKSFVENEHKELGGQVVAALREATQIIWGFTKPTKERPIPPITNAQAGKLVDALRSGYYEGRFKEADLAELAARWATHKAVEKAVTDNLPLAQAIGGGARVTDTTEQFINDTFNHWYAEWRDRDDAGDLGSRIDQHARQIAQRVQEYAGAPPTKYAVQSNGEVWVWYANPKDPSNPRRGTLYRFAPTVIDQKTNQYNDPAPKIQVFEEGALDWKTAEDQRPYPERKAAERSKAAQEARATTLAEENRRERERALAEEEALRKRAAEIRLEDWYKSPSGAWFSALNDRPADAETTRILEEKQRQSIERQRKELLK